MAREFAMASKRRKAPAPEEIWVREFVSFYGTDNATRVIEGTLSGVSLTRVVAALADGSLVESIKRDGSGCECQFIHRSEDDTVEVWVFFEAMVMKLEILSAKVVVEIDDEPNAA